MKAENQAGKDADFFIYFRFYRSVYDPIDHRVRNVAGSGGIRLLHQRGQKGNTHRGGNYADVDRIDGSGGDSSGIRVSGHGSRDDREGDRAVRISGGTGSADIGENVFLFRGNRASD